MERDAFDLMAAAEREHWWFRGRREFIKAALERVAVPVGGRLLDAGCGSGGNLSLLSSFGATYGFEYDAQALDAARQLGIGIVQSGSLPEGIPFEATRFDAIGLFDVLEHLERPVASLAALRRRLTAQGALVITVPANPWLWGPHDVVHQHFRRYSSVMLREHLRAAGLAATYVSYFNSLLLPLAIVQRLRERVFGYSTDDLAPSPRVNQTLFNVFRFERHWIPARQAPFGLSLMAIAERAPGVIDGD